LPSSAQDPAPAGLSLALLSAFPHPPHPRTSSEIAGNEQNWLFNIGRSTLVEYKSVLNNLKNGRQPQWKTTSAEDNLSGRQPHWKTTSVEDDLPRRQPQWKMTSVEPSVEDDLIGSKPHWKTTSVEDDLSGRQP
jgi:hypothetical protein